MYKHILATVIAIYSLSSQDLSAAKKIDMATLSHKGLRFTSDLQANDAKAHAINLIIQDLENRCEAYDAQASAYGLDAQGVVDKVQGHLKRYQDKANSCLNSESSGDCSLLAIWEMHKTVQHEGRDDVGNTYNTIEASLSGADLEAFKAKRDHLREHQSQWGIFCDSLDATMGAASTCEAGGFNGQGCSHSEVIATVTAAFNVADAASPIPEVVSDSVADNGSKVEDGNKVKAEEKGEDSSSEE